MKPAETPAANGGTAKSLKDQVATGDTKLIEELAEAATPRQIQQWIVQLETLFEQKKQRVRKDLQERVNDLIALNGYTLEELFSARVLPSTSDLAELSRKNGQAQRDKADKLIETAIRN
ncbi:MAG: hypothetical protein R3D57_08055 [Hyphomicrobiaceae bacterium]